MYENLCLGRESISLTIKYCFAKILKNIWEEESLSSMNSFARGKFCPKFNHRTLQADVSFIFTATEELMIQIADLPRWRRSKPANEDLIFSRFRPCRTKIKTAFLLNQSNTLFTQSDSWKVNRWNGCNKRCQKIVLLWSDDGASAAPSATDAPSLACLLVRFVIHCLQSPRLFRLSVE